MRSVRSESRWSIVVCDITGQTIDSVPMLPDDRIRHLKYFANGPHDRPVITFKTSEDTLLFYSEQLQPVMSIAYSSSPELQGFHDFTGAGTPQMFLSTLDGRLWLLGRDLEPLAQFAEGISPSSFRVIEGDEGAPGALLQVNAQANTENYFFRVVRTPWYTIFYRHPLLAAAAGVTPLAAILAVIGIAMIRGRRKNLIISRQKDELAKALTDLHAAQAKLVEAEKSQLTHDIAGGVAHEIRNALDPAVQCLNALRGEMQGSDERIAAMLDLSRRSVSRAIRMTRLVRELSDLADSAHTDSIALVPVIDDVLGRNLERIKSSGIDVTVDLPGSVAVMCSRDHAGILFGNLIANAIDAMAGTDDRRLMITGTLTNGSAVIRVADTGPGISRDEGSRIFNAFYSTKPSTGMGLGLTLCKRIAAIYRGSLTLDFETNKGATFVVTLPASEPEGTIRHDQPKT